MLEHQSKVIVSTRIAPVTRRIERNTSSGTLNIVRINSTWVRCTFRKHVTQGLKTNQPITIVSRHITIMLLKRKLLSNVYINTLKMNYLEAAVKNLWTTIPLCPDSPVSLHYSILLQRYDGCPQNSLILPFFLPHLKSSQETSTYTMAKIYWRQVTTILICSPPPYIFH